MSGTSSIRHVVIRGLVQRVGYRAWTEHTALLHGLEGWVRNRSDGSVEAVFAGPGDKIAVMIESCRHGPRGAQVEEIREREGGPDDLALVRPGEQFSVLATS
jgi:acylphosphatase